MMTKNTELRARLAYAGKCILFAAIGFVLANAGCLLYLCLID